MSDSTQHPKPTEPEQHMFQVHDLFAALLEKNPAQAAALAKQTLALWQPTSLSAGERYIKNTYGRPDKKGTK